MVGSTENHLHLRDGDAEHSLNFTSIHPSALFCFPFLIQVWIPRELLNKCAADKLHLKDPF